MEHDVLRSEIQAGVADLVKVQATRDALQRSFEQSQADAHAAPDRTDVLRHQLDAAASERATAVSKAEAKAYADSQIQQELRRF